MGDRNWSIMGDSRRKCPKWGSQACVRGDSTKKEDVRRLWGNVAKGAMPRLMVTDPPYGVEYEPKWRADRGVNENQGKMGKVANDDRVDWSPAWALFPGAVCVCLARQLVYQRRTSLSRGRWFRDPVRNHLGEGSIRTLPRPLPLAA
jgi:hypothetical protein